MDFNFSQYIEDNVEEAASGVKGENSVKLFGNDLNVLAATAGKIRDVMQTVPGITDLAVFNPLGQPTIRVDVDRERASRLGLAPGDINATVQSAIGGQSAGDLYEAGSDRHFPMMVRLAQPFRADLDSIRRITVGAPDPTGGAAVVPVPLADVANVRLVSGPSFIYREQQQRYVPIKFSVRGRDLGSAVLDAQARVARSVAIPGGYRLEWVGEFGNLNDALQRLKIAVPVSLALICILLFINFGSIVDVLLAVSVIPMALIGGIFALALTGTPFSVSAAIGFVALFGIATMDGIIVLSYYNLHIEQGMDRVAAILHTCRVQMRPVMMTCIVACVGLVPAAAVQGYRLAGAASAGAGGGRRHAARAGPGPVRVAVDDSAGLPAALHPANRGGVRLRARGRRSWNEDRHPLPERRWGWRHARSGRTSSRHSSLADGSLYGGGRAAAVLRQRRGRAVRVVDDLRQYRFE